MNKFAFLLMLFLNSTALNARHCPCTCSCTRVNPRCPVDIRQGPGFNLFPDTVVDTFEPADTLVTPEVI